ncbi:molybdate ABC transporter substrate-binding protein [Stackebrandtia soli]|uniref:molybdate ABC transporter substrate-binding protein n=1 Tax=Stackebrandtia soli TaxID=1892856 RepID=UPI0039E85F28
MRTLRTLAAAVLALSIVGGCSGTPTDEPGGGITVFAAASLTESFTQIGEGFEDANPGTTVKFNFAGSSALAQQINDGAPADVFASASPTNMDQVAATDAVTETPAVFVRNRLQIAVPAGNPAGITGLDDFSDPDLKIGLCAEAVPCGAAAMTAFAAAGVTPAPDTLEKDVKAVLTKVRLGELDAALVYRTDVIAADDEVDGIDFTEADKAVNDYPIAVCANAPNPDAAADFVAFVGSDEAQAILTKAGFELP